MTGTAEIVFTDPEPFWDVVHRISEIVGDVPTPAAPNASTLVRRAWTIERYRRLRGDGNAGGGWSGDDQ